MPSIGQIIAYDVEGIIKATIIAVLSVRANGGYLIRDSRGETHVIHSSGPNIPAPFYVDHLADAFDGSIFQY